MPSRQMYYNKVSDRRPLLYRAVLFGIRAAAVVRVTISPPVFLMARFDEAPRDAGNVNSPPFLRCGLSAGQP